MIFKPLKKKKKFGLNQTSTPSQSPTVNGKTLVLGFFQIPGPKALLFSNSQTPSSFPKCNRLGGIIY